MKNILAKVLFVSFISISILGLFSMVQSKEHGGMSGCIVEISRQGSCPWAMSDFNLLMYHLDVFKGFTQSSISNIFSIIFLILILVLRYIPPFHEKLKTNVGNSLNPSLFSIRRKLSEWFILLKNSPSY